MLCILVTQSCLTLCNPLDCSLPGSSVHEILHARILEWVAILFSRGSFPTQGLNSVSHIASRFFVIVVQSPSCVQLLGTSWTAACQASLSLTISWSLSTFMSLALVMPSNHLILCCPLLLLVSIFPNIRVFSSESFSQQVAKVYELQLKHQSFQWVFKVDFF